MSYKNNIILKTDSAHFNFGDYFKYRYPQFLRDWNPYKEMISRSFISFSGILAMTLSPD